MKCVEHYINKMLIRKREKLKLKKILINKPKCGKMKENLKMLKIKDSKTKLRKSMQIIKIT